MRADIKTRRLKINNVRERIIEAAIHGNSKRPKRTSDGTVEMIAMGMRVTVAKTEMFLIDLVGYFPVFTSDQKRLVIDSIFTALKAKDCKRVKTEKRIIRDEIIITQKTSTFIMEMGVAKFLKA